MMPPLITARGARPAMGNGTGKCRTRAAPHRANSGLKCVTRRPRPPAWPHGAELFFEKIIHRHPPARNDGFRLRNISATVDHRGIRRGKTVDWDDVTAEQINVPDHQRP